MAFSYKAMSLLEIEEQRAAKIANVAGAFSDNLPALAAIERLAYERCLRRWA